MDGAADAGHAHARVIERFYEAFTRRDAEEMVACYHADVRFSDPVFGTLDSARAKDMWRMLCARGKDLEISFSNVTADDERGAAHWEARYTFTGTGRLVHNVIEARFEFADGKIKQHHDTFDLWRWCGMALGPIGRVFGWLPPLQRSIQSKALTALDAWQRRSDAASAS
jgi:ketosteroid isomerase-like protein